MLQTYKDSENPRRKNKGARNSECFKMKDGNIFFLRTNRRSYFQNLTWLDLKCHSSSGEMKHREEKARELLKNSLKSRMMLVLIARTHPSVLKRREKKNAPLQQQADKTYLCDLRAEIQDFLGELVAPLAGAYQFHHGFYVLLVLLQLRLEALGVEQIALAKAR